MTIDNRSLSSLHLPRRSGARPSTRKPTPHQQLTQNAPVALQNQLFQRTLELPGVYEGDSGVSVDGARAFMLRPELAAGPARSFMVGGEFAHLHPDFDGSLHLTLPPAIGREVTEMGWGEPHPLALLWGGTAAVYMVYGPRTAEELEAVWQIVRASYELARGNRSAS